MGTPTPSPPDIGVRRHPASYGQEGVGAPAFHAYLLWNWRSLPTVHNSFHMDEVHDVVSFEDIIWGLSRETVSAQFQMFGCVAIGASRGCIFHHSRSNQ